MRCMWGSDHASVVGELSWRGTRHAPQGGQDRGQDHRPGSPSLCSSLRAKLSAVTFRERS